MPAPSRARRGAGTRSGGSAGVAVEVDGLADFRRELRQLEEPRQWSAKLGRLHRELAQKVAGWASFTASGMGGATGHFAGALAGRGSVTGARIQVANPAANAAFWGAKQRTGWNAGNDTPNLPEWVGNAWDVGVAGQGPYAINDTIAAKGPEILDMYGEAVEDIASAAFPN